MTKRYYYTDPLAAAWMSKHFNINIEWADGTITDNYTGDNIVYYEKYLGTESPYYIHPDSEHILNPQVGDLVHNFRWQSHFMIERDNDLLAVNNAMKVGTRYSIIQRNNIPFMWPEVDEVKQS